MAKMNWTRIAVESRDARVRQQQAVPYSFFSKIKRKRANKKSAQKSRISTVAIREIPEGLPRAGMNERMGLLLDPSSSGASTKPPIAKRQAEANLAAKAMLVVKAKRDAKLKPERRERATVQLREAIRSARRKTYREVSLSSSSKNFVVSKAEAAIGKEGPLAKSSGSRRKKKHKVVIGKLPQHKSAESDMSRAPANQCNKELGFNSAVMRQHGPRNEGRLPRRNDRSQPKGPSPAMFVVCEECTLQVLVSDVVQHMKQRHGRELKPGSTNIGSKYPEAEYEGQPRFEGGRRHLQGGSPGLSRRR